MTALAAEVESAGWREEPPGSGVYVVEPVRHGPTWRRGPDGRFVMPRFSLGWHVLSWAGEWLRHGDGRPWRYTPEQARFVVWWYALDPETGLFLYRDGFLQRLKGWGKDPLAATLCAVEFIGPCRPVPLPEGGVRMARFRTPPGVDELQPVAVPHPEAWVQTYAVSQDQTKNTMSLLPGMIPEPTRKRYGVDKGKLLWYAEGGQKRLEAVTSSSETAEGGRTTFAMRNEVQFWRSSNGGHDLAGAIDGNLAKSPDGNARALSIGNAWRPDQDSLAERTFDTWEKGETGRAVPSGILYDSLEAPPGVPLTPEVAPYVVEAVRGDATWLSPVGPVRSILDLRNPPSESRRKWYNSVTAPEDSWVDPAEFKLCARPGARLRRRDAVVMFGDGSKSDDATGLVLCRLSDGLVVTRAMWQRPPVDRGGIGWTAPREAVDREVQAVFRDYDVRAFWFDPSHTLEDETRERYWDALCDEWHARWSSQLKLWAVRANAATGAVPHAVMWDMAISRNVERFTAAAERGVDDIVERKLQHDDDPRLRDHVRNAKRAPNAYGTSVRKVNRESARKIDLAVCMIGARMLRRAVLLAPASNRRQKVPGRAWGAR